MNANTTSVTPTTSSRPSECRRVNTSPDNAAALTTINCASTPASVLGRRRSMMSFTTQTATRLDSQAGSLGPVRLKVGLPTLLRSVAAPGR